MRAQKTTLAALALVAGLSLTACQGNDDAATGSSDSGSSTPSSSSSSAGSADSSGSNASEQGSTATASSDTGGNDSAAEGSGGGQINTGPCKTANLAFGVTHGMGEGDLLVSLRNTSDACSLKGFPGVDLKVDSGPGAISATRTGLATPTVVLKNGETTRFTVHSPRNDTGGSGVNIDRIVVTPPNGTHSKTLSITLNLPASASPTDAGVTVDPVGTGKQ
ncbi:DUF4232 domain-containing protein [Streptomyces sp. SID14478]|uniref:DUF4232 domain-containing protein n=1 Tax=Streptomyces sp. SID14478 TaxID=2706073 RepID=UPI0013D93677|nr:DUF4232 domain-containing protein [Streptomyces sp. SID14478]NEB79330.1 DUF4232 domain-containing protein [Streptomyces sp. SID14478]